MRRDIPLARPGRAYLHTNPGSWRFENCCAPTPSQSDDAYRFPALAEPDEYDQPRYRRDEPERLDLAPGGAVTGANASARIGEPLLRCSPHGGWVFFKHHGERPCARP